METGPTSIGDRDFSALELPVIIQEIVDGLQPLLTPYDAAFYWYAFRHSIVRNGNPHVRLSGRALKRGVVLSSKSNAIENVVSEMKQRFVRYFEPWKPLVQSVRKVKPTGRGLRIES
jgi:hypothetical protein